MSLGDDFRANSITRQQYESSLQRTELFKKVEWSEKRPNPFEEGDILAKYARGISGRLERLGTGG